MMIIAGVVLATAALLFLGAAVVMWRAVFCVDLGALDRSRKAERVVMTEAVAMLHAGVHPWDVTVFLSNGLKATALPGDTPPNPG